MPEDEIESLTKDQAIKIEKDFMEDGEPIILRDKITYIIPPLLLKDAKKLMNKLETIDTDLIIINFIANDEGVTKEDELFEVLLLGFKYNYPDMAAERLEEICDLQKAKEIINLMIGLNGLKK